MRTVMVKKCLMGLLINSLTIMPGWANVNISLKVTVLSAPSCTINGNRPIVIDFGKEVMTTRVDGHHYRQRVPYTLTCDNPKSLSMRMLIQGTAANFDATALQTSMPALGVIFWSDGKKWPVNTMYGFKYSALPMIEAQLIKDEESRLQAGEFTAAATLEVFYQ
ncbi:fimbrial protein [Serratia marcescens]|nr:fimbrial protein [Serratia marcescens]